MVRLLPRTGSHVSRHRLHHSGVRPLRVLLVGDRDRLLEPVDGASLSRRVLDRVWLTTRRGVDLDVLVDLEPVLQRATAAADDWRLWRYDAVVVVEDGTAPRQRSRVQQQVAGLLRADSAHRTPVVLATAAPARRAVTAEERRSRDDLLAAGSGSLHAMEVPSTAAEPQRAREWATGIGAEVAAVVAESGRSADDADDEAARQRALDESGVLGRGHVDRLDDLAELARSAFGTDGAAINFLDRDRQWKLATAGVDAMGTERGQAFCSRTIERAAPLVVGDVRARPDLAGLADGRGAIRFYAAHPIESVDGYRIGSFCVFDSEPRDVRDLDVAVLRDLALLAQAELIEQDSAPVGVSARLRRSGA